MDFMTLPQFKEWALTKGFTEEQCNQYYNGGGLKRREMFERGDEGEVEIKFKRWVGIVNSDKPKTPRKPKIKVKEFDPMYQSIIDYIGTATTEQLNGVISELQAITDICKANIDKNKESDIKSKESQINVVLQQLKEMGVEYELVKK